MPTRRAVAAPAAAGLHARSCWWSPFFGCLDLRRHLDRPALVQLASATARSSARCSGPRSGCSCVFGAADGRSSSAANMVVAYRLRPLFRPHVAGAGRASTATARSVTPIRRWLLVAVARRSSALFAGGSGVGQVAAASCCGGTGEPFGSDDPYFHKDIGFYVFDLPWLHYLVDFAMAALVRRAARRRGRALPVRRDPAAGHAATGSPVPAQAQISVLLGLFVLAQGRRLLARPLRPDHRSRAA